MSIRSISVTSAGLFLLASFSASAAEETPVGTWRTFDDVDGSAASLIRIEERDGVLEGKVVQLFPRKGRENTHPLCSKCKGDNRNQPIVGMMVVFQMRKKGEQYQGGQILDPDSGSTYHCTMRLVDGELKVRGYLGVALLGRTQTWKREP